MDHGKSTLVKAITGTDPDRFREEKARGLTIDLGFGVVRLSSGRTISIVDVPGHERFIRNMLAGVGAIDACLFVVAANEGWMPQSEEHLRILEFLGVSNGVIALTKVAACDTDIADLARLEVAEKVHGTFLSDAPIISTDAVSSIGILELTTELDNLLNRTPGPSDVKRPRLWIDRVFAAKGAGTVVTGTLSGGHLSIQDELLLLPNHNNVRVRALQTHYDERSEVSPGQRVALNLSGVAHQDITRGHVLVKASQWHLTSRFDASLVVLSNLSHDVSRRGAYTLHIGSSELPAKMRVLSKDAISPGAQGMVRLHIARRLPLLPGDRFVLRESGRSETIGGGTVLDVSPVLAAAKARPDLSPDRVIVERGWVEATEFALLTGQIREPTVGRWLVAPAVLEQTTNRLRLAVKNAGSIGLDIATLNDQERAVLATLTEIEAEGGRARFSQQPDTFRNHRYIAALEDDLFAPPTPETANVSRTEVRELIKRGLVVEQNGIFFAVKAVTEAQRVLAQMLADKPEGITVAEIRQHLGTSRKYALALLAYFDANGVTRRQGDYRTAGPRLAAVN